MRHMAKAAVAAERAGVPISALLKSRDDSASAGGAPEAEAEQHARIYTPVGHQSAGRRREPLDNTRSTLVPTLTPSARADLSKTTTCTKIRSESVTSTRCTRRGEQRGTGQSSKTTRST